MICLLEESSLVLDRTDAAVFPKCNGTLKGCGRLP